MATLANIISDLTKTIEKTVSSLTINATANLRQDCPVDTGFARSNFIPTIGQPFSGTAGTYGNTNDQIQNDGVAQVGGYSLKQGAVYITNNVEYITDLNAGASPQQSSPDFVGRALERTLAQAASAGAIK